MNQPGRKYSAGSGYRYGFNGKELDKDISGSNYDYGFRIFNSQIGRFLSTDPLSAEYPWNSPFAYAENDVLRCIDIDGLEKLIVIINKDQFGRTKGTILEGIRDKDVKKAVDVNLKYVNKSDVTTSDVLIITRQENKIDQMSFDDMNDSYRNKIKNAPIAKSDGENPPVDDMPEGVDVQYNQNETFRNKALTGKNRYDAAKYDYFYFEQSFPLSKPVELKQGLLLNVSSSYLLEANASIEADDITKRYSDFSTNHKDLTVTIIKITIRGKPQAQKDMEALKKVLLSRQPSAIITIVPDKKFDIMKNGGSVKSSSGVPYTPDEHNRSYRVDLNISGVN